MARRKLGGAGNFGLAGMRGFFMATYNLPTKLVQVHFTGVQVTYGNVWSPPKWPHIREEGQF